MCQDGERGGDWGGRSEQFLRGASSADVQGYIENIISIEKEKI
jgi:hypothetical protein